MRATVQDLIPLGGVFHRFVVAELQLDAVGRRDRGHSLAGLLGRGDLALERRSALSAWPLLLLAKREAERDKFVLEGLAHAASSFLGAIKSATDLRIASSTIRCISARLASNTSSTCLGVMW